MVVQEDAANDIVGNRVKGFHELTIFSDGTKLF